MNIRSIKSISKLALITAATAFFFVSCNLNTSPDQFFGVAVLNTNTISDFGTDRLARHIEMQAKDIPSTKKKGDEAVIYVNNNVLYMEKVLKDIKELPENADTKEIRDLSLSIYEDVIPVYKNEYTAYAKLFLFPAIRQTSLRKQAHISFQCSESGVVFDLLEL